MHPVLCIISRWKTLAGWQFPLPKLHQEYHVVGEFVSQGTGKVLYELAEFPPIRKNSFRFQADAFIKLPTQEEIEAEMEGMDLDRKLQEIFDEVERREYEKGF